MNPRIQQLITFSRKRKRSIKKRLGRRFLGKKPGIGISRKALITGLAGVGAYAAAAPVLNHAYQKAVYPYTPSFRFSRLQKLAEFSRRRGEGKQ
jgi:hypothetical protein